MSETTAPAGRATSTAAPTAIPGPTAVPGPTGVPAARTKATARGKGARISLRALQIALALFYGLASALPKLIAHPSAVESFDTLGWGSAGMYTIGLLELAGAVEHPADVVVRLQPQALQPRPAVSRITGSSLTGPGFIHSDRHNASITPEPQLSQ